MGALTKRQIAERERLEQARRMFNKESQRVGRLKGVGLGHRTNRENYHATLEGARAAARLIEASTPMARAVALVAQGFSQGVSAKVAGVSKNGLYKSLKGNAV